MTSYRIDGKTVPRTKFDALFATLKETGGWYCEETTTGGQTGWEAADPKGVKFRYTAVTDGDKNVQDLERL